MASPSIPNDIILFGYPSSPYFRRVKHYLAFRNIAYAECIQPPILPRPDLQALGVHYRRIPVMAIGRDVYVDSRIMIRRLEELYPASDEHPALYTPESRGLAKVLNRTVSDPGGVFVRCAAFLDQRFAAVRDPAFVKDRQEFFGGKWGEGDLSGVRNEAVVGMRLVFGEMEELLLDGREWMAGGEKVSGADLEAEWPLDWVLVDLQAPADIFNDNEFPKTFAWIGRYRAALKAATTKAGKPAKVNGKEAIAFVQGARYTDDETGVDALDPLGFQQGSEVEVFPTDGGGAHRDRGSLVKLTKGEVAIAVKSGGRSEIRVHAPRWNFKVRNVEAKMKL